MGNDTTLDARTGEASSLLARIGSLLDSSAAMAGLGVLVFACGLFIYAGALPHNDIAWLLLAAEKVLDGAEISRQVVEINPPLIIYENVPPVLLARLTGLASTTAFVAYVFILTAITLVLIWQINACARPNGSVRDGRALFLASAAVFSFFPAIEFGQREHLMLIFCLPYIFLTLRRAQYRRWNRWAAVFVGLWAGLGFGLKPHFLLLPILLEVYLFARSRQLSLRPEAIAAGVVVAAYAVSIPLLSPLYLVQTVPYAWLVYDLGYGQPLAEVLWCWQSFALLGLVAWHLTTRAGNPYRTALDISAICAIVFYFVYVIQLKTFYYHLLPVSAALFLILALMALAAPGRGPHAHALSAGAILAMGAMLVNAVAMGTYRNPVAEPILAAMTTYARGSSVFVLSSYIWVGFPMTSLAEVRWPSRFAGFWTLPGAERQLQHQDLTSDPDRIRTLREAETYTTDAVVEDFESDPPALVIVDEHDRRFEGLDFSYLDYFERDTRFRRLWQNYRRIGAICVGDFGPYALYVDEQSPAARQKMPLDKESLCPQ